MMPQLSAGIHKNHILESTAPVRFKARTTYYLELLTNEINAFSAELNLAQAKWN